MFSPRVFFYMTKKFKLFLWKEEKKTTFFDKWKKNVSDKRYGVWFEKQIDKNMIGELIKSQFLI